MDEKEFKDRTKKFALRVIRLVQSLPNDRAADVLGKQLIDQPPLSPQIIDLPVGPNQRPI